MLLESRIRRLRSFEVWFKARYPDASPPPVPHRTQEERIIGQERALKYYIETFHPICYWCGGHITADGFESEGIDPYTIHHVDEDRDNNEIDNLVIIHKTCHQTMHKASQLTNIPAYVVRELVQGNKNCLDTEVAKRIMKQAREVE